MAFFNWKIQRKFQLIFLVVLIQSCSGGKGIGFDFQPMKPTGTLYSAYNENGLWALEMDLYGDFVFQDFSSGLKVVCKSSDYVVKKRGFNQQMEWNMYFGGDLEKHVSLKILKENCHNFGFINNPFVLEISHDQEVIYRLGDCGSFHNDFQLDGVYELATVNRQAASSYYQLPSAPILNLKKLKTSSDIEGRLACRYFRGNIDYKEMNLSLFYNVHPTDDCSEPESQTKFMEEIGNKSFFFKSGSDPILGKTLTLSDKYNTFVFKKKS